jgi:CHAT domain-containing protein
MFNDLIPSDVQQVLWDNRDKIDSILVIAEEPFIPWELVHLGEPGKPLSADTRFLGQMGLVRWLHEAGWPNEQLSIRDGQARYVIPHYPHPDYVLPEAQLESQFLETEFGATAVAPKSGEVPKLLAKPGAFDLLHFACHGVADLDNISGAQLLMEGRVEGTKYILDPLTATTAEAHANLKSDHQAPMIVLNACQAGRAGYKLTGVGGFAQAFLRRGAGAFVGTLWSVGDSPARNFTEEFYRQLKGGKTISEATIEAREKARSAGDATWLAYVVYGHPHAILKVK